MWFIEMDIYHIDMVILDIDMGYGLMIWEMTVSIRSSPISIWDVLSLCERPAPQVATSAMSGMVKGRMLRPLCHSHSATTASASDFVGIASATREPGSSPGAYTLVHCSAQLEPCLTHTKHPTHPLQPLTPPSHGLHNPYAHPLFHKKCSS
jgi:hypothetical protein